MDRKLETKTGLSLTVPQSTGPKTVAGKRRSRINATKHGIFSRSLILDGESRSDFDRVFCDCVIQFQPQGPIEEYLVEQLAIQMWRRTRVLRAETSLISRSPAFMGGRPESDLPNSYSLRTSCELGSVPIKTRVDLLENAAEQMNDLWRAVEARGFDFEKDASVIRSVYGRLEDHPSKQPNGSSLLWAVLIIESNLWDLSFKNYVKKLVIDLIQAERDRFYYLAVEEKKKELTFASHSALILGETDLDRILRYETHISREFDRVLSQLERLQSARRSPTRG